MANWVYHQDTGKLYHAGTFIGAGYSGQPPRVNDPSAEAIQSVGPIPRGLYKIGTAYHHPHLGPVVMNLDAEPGNDAHGRSEFRFHGESVTPPEGYASHGCIIMARPIREAIAASVIAGDADLLVCLSTDPR